MNIFGKSKYYSYICDRKNKNMKFSDVKSKIGDGRLITVETSVYHEAGETCPCIFVRDYDETVDFSDSVYFPVYDFVHTVKNSKIVEAIKSAFSCNSIFAYTDYCQSAEEANSFSNGIKWVNVITSKQGNTAECSCTYLLSVPENFDFETVDEKEFNGVKIYASIN